MRNLMAAIAVAFVVAGCSGGEGIPFSPPLDEVSSRFSEGGNHVLWGLWQGIIDPAAETIEFTQLRTSEFHLNAMPFLEPPAFLNLTLESLEFNGNIIEADIGLRHPFLGLTEFTGFDVCGIFISNGSMIGYTDPDIVIAGEGDTRLLNPDALSRWWNPTEFPVNTGTIFGYNDGLLGTPDDIADFNSTLNGYKYFCDDLVNPTDPLSLVTLEKRGLFSAGKKNIRHYTIEMGNDGLIFNYAVDASWLFPNGQPPWKAPDDFTADANRAEAWRLNISETQNTLWNDGQDSGGELSLSIDAYDWFDAELNSVRVESPGNLPMAESATPVGGGEGYSTYEIDITGATPDETSIDLLISIASEGEDFEGFIPGVNTTAYFTYTAPVATESPTDPAEPVLGNVWLEVLRDTYPTITGLQISWIDNSEPYFAVYADTDPYDAIGVWGFVTEVELTTAQIDISNLDEFSGNGGYFFTVLARSVSGSPASESVNSELCFCEMEDFDGGVNPNEWTIGYRNATYKWTIVNNGQIDGSSSLRIDPHPIGYWSVIMSDPLPAVADSDLSFIEFAHETTTHWARSAFTSYSIGHSNSPPPQGTSSNYLDFDGPVDFDAIMDDTFGWVAPGTGPPPDYEPGGGWIPLVQYFGWPDPPLPSHFFGWRLHDGPHGGAEMSRVKHDWYIDDAPGVRAGLGYGSSIWENFDDWGEFDEIAVVVY